MTASADWAGDLGRKWAARHAALHRQLSEISEIGLAALDPRPGEWVLDLGCGAGPTTRRIAEAVGPGGRVTGIDISAELLALARAACSGLAQADFVNADAGTHDFGSARYDALFSRFGSMFFDDPPAAFANLHSALVPDGRAVFLVYTEIGRNPWAMLPAEIGARILGPAEPSPPGAPGPFGWADPGYFRPVLEAGGFHGIAWEAHDLEVEIGAGDDPDPIVRAVTLLTQMGPLARRLRDAPEGAEEAVRAPLAEALAPFVKDGAVRLAASIWAVTASA